MESRIFISALAVLLLVFAPAAFIQADEITQAEKAKIEALIAQLEGLRDAKFIRNGSSYDGKTAAKFLRGKWHSHEKEIKNAGDFITKAATGSSTSGKPYMIQLKSGEVPSSDYLNAQLKKLGDSPYK